MQTRNMEKSENNHQFRIIFNYDIFDKYFSTVWNANKQRIGEDLDKKIFSNPKITAVQAADEILTKELPLLVKEAVTNMFESNAFKGANDENSQAYAELIDTINNTQGGNEYLNQLYNLYHLDVHPIISDYYLILRFLHYLVRGLFDVRKDEV